VAARAALCQSWPMSEAEHDQEPAPAPAEDDVKQKFREALERKQAQRHRAEQSAGANGKAAHSHGQAGGKRTFRRKSG
jgi:Family of unknown function (DUF5302)